MSCPHSTRFEVTPDTCSQCVGYRPRVIAYDESLERLTIDGVPIVQYVATMRNTMPTGPRPCARCGRPGHRAKTCNVTSPREEYYSMETN